MLDAPDRKETMGEYYACRNYIGTSINFYNLFSIHRRLGKRWLWSYVARACFSAQQNACRNSCCRSMWQWSLRVSIGLLNGVCVVMRAWRTDRVPSGWLSNNVKHVRHDSQGTCPRRISFWNYLWVPTPYPKQRNYWLSYQDRRTLMKRQLQIVTYYSVNGCTLKVTNISTVCEVTHQLRSEWVGL